MSVRDGRIAAPVSCVSAALVAAVLLLGLVGSNPPAHAAVGEKPLPSRQAFARRMDRVTRGMTTKQVHALLGRPDRVAPSLMDRAPGTKTWYYGCEGTDAVPTLGQVHFAANGAVLFRPGTEGKPPAPSLLPERELRRALCLLDQTHSPGLRYDPLPIIRAVNGLLPLGKERALAAVEEYGRVLGQDDDRPTHYTDKDGPFLVLRCLFEVEPPPTRLRAGHRVERLAPEYGPDGTPRVPAAPLPGYLPEMYLGLTSPPEPADPTQVPRLPLVLIDDIPLAIVYRGIRGGPAQPVSEHVAYYRRWARLRSQPLCPSGRLWEVLAQVEASSQWLHGRRYVIGYGEAGGKPSYHDGDADERARGLSKIKSQLLCLVLSLYPGARQTETIRYGNGRDEMDYPFEVGDPSQWDRVVADLKRHPIRWNATHNRYERMPATAASTTAFRPFAEVPTDTPGERATEKLRRAGILVGYPPGSVPEDNQR
jgi:hypothetical protein